MNDPPALAVVIVAIALSSGTPEAVEEADPLDAMAMLVEVGCGA
jgi:cation transport ATPase